MYSTCVHVRRRAASVTAAETTSTVCTYVRAVDARGGGRVEDDRRGNGAAEFAGDDAPRRWMYVLYIPYRTVLSKSESIEMMFLLFLWRGVIWSTDNDRTVLGEGEHVQYTVHTV